MASSDFYNAVLQNAIGAQAGGTGGVVGEVLRYKTGNKALDVASQQADLDYRARLFEADNQTAQKRIGEDGLTTRTGLQQQGQTERNKDNLDAQRKTEEFTLKIAQIEAQHNRESAERIAQSDLDKTALIEGTKRLDNADKNAINLFKAQGEQRTQANADSIAQQQQDIVNQRAELQQQINEDEYTQRKVSRQQAVTKETFDRAMVLLTRTGAVKNGRLVPENLNMADPAQLQVVSEVINKIPGVTALIRQRPAFKNGGEFVLKTLPDGKVMIGVRGADGLEAPLTTGAKPYTSETAPDDVLVVDKDYIVRLLTAGQMVRSAADMSAVDFLSTNAEILNAASADLQASGKAPEPSAPVSAVTGQVATKDVPHIAQELDKWTQANSSVLKGVGRGKTQHPLYALSQIKNDVQRRAAMQVYIQEGKPLPGGFQSTGTLADAQTSSAPALSTRQPAKEKPQHDAFTLYNALGKNISHAVDVQSGIPFSALQQRERAQTLAHEQELARAKAAQNRALAPSTVEEQEKFHRMVQENEAFNKGLKAAAENWVRLYGEDVEGFWGRLFGDADYPKNFDEPVVVEKAVKKRVMADPEKYMKMLGITSPDEFFSSKVAAKLLDIIVAEVKAEEDKD